MLHMNLGIVAEIVKKLKVEEEEKMETCDEVISNIAEKEKENKNQWSRITKGKFMSKQLRRRGNKRKKSALL